MKKNIIILLIASCAGLLPVACTDQLNVAPVSNISDPAFWKNSQQVDAFVSGIHARFRTHNIGFQTLGELRADIFATEPGASGVFTGEAPEGRENAWNQNLTLDNMGVLGVTGFAGFYSNIVQINLLISRLNEITFVKASDKSYYLGIAYGMRAFYYFHLVRSWGKVVLITDPFLTYDIANLSKAAATEDEIMAQIKKDVESSLTNYGTDYGFRNTKGFWSKAATLMLKAEVFLWTSRRGGGAADAAVAKNSLTDIQTNVPSLALLPSFENVFTSTNRGNNEIIFSIRYQNLEATMGFLGAYIPQSTLIINYYDSLNDRAFNTTDNWGGILRAPVRIATYQRFRQADTRRLGSLQPAYSYDDATKIYTIKGVFVRKYPGEQVSGARQITNDFPIYRYADLLLLLAEAKVILGEDPSAEINRVRARALGSAYNVAVHGYPNQTIDANANEALLQERFFEFIMEGKRWYDLRRFGDSYVFGHTSVKSTEAYKLLWPIDRGSLINNRLLVQNIGYLGI